MVLSSTFRIVQQRRRRQLGPISLRDQCIRIVLNNKAFYVNYHITNGINPFAELPDFLINELREKEIGNIYTSEYELQHLFINPRMKSIEIASKLDSPSFKKIWDALNDNKPPLETFIWERWPILFDQRVTFDAVMSYGGLKILSLTQFPQNDGHLEEIASKLKSLRVLKIGLEERNVTLRGLTALSKLENLQDFQFNEYDREPNDHPVYQEIFNQCLHLMPKLHTIGTSVFIAINHVLGYPIDRPISSILELNLKQILLKNCGTIPPNIRLPQLKELYLMHPIENINADERFSNVTVLGMYKISLRSMFRAIQLIGKNIEKLVISHIVENINLGEVFRLCPNLKEFEMPESPEQFIMTGPFLPFVQQLENLSIDLVSPHNSSFPDGMLAHLLKAPALKKVAFNCLYVTQEETNSIVKGVEEGTMLQNLESFQYFNYTACDNDDPSNLAAAENVSDEEFFNPILRGRFDVLFKKLALHCPKFVNLVENN
ncbi:uncharacterized protein LOC135940866 [Cloeon dipterum]|uniref:uncharacterized protein LOC135940866 n=1 Tax=Cloeon dipterum TaxID=197152 RepID=UPI0032201D39